MIKQAKSNPKIKDLTGYFYILEVESFLGVKRFLETSFEGSPAKIFENPWPIQSNL